MGTFITVQPLRLKTSNAQLKELITTFLVC